MDQSSEDSEFTSLDQQSMASWMLAQGLDSPRLHWFVDYACRDDFGTHAKHTSAWAGIHYYASRLRGLGSEPQPILTWPEGNAYLVQGLARDLGTHFRLGLGALDVRVVARHDRTEADVVAIGSGNLARGFRAKRVIFAAPQFLAKRIVRDLRESKSPPGNGFEYGAWMVANITLRERPRLHRVQGTRMAWDNVIYDSPGLGYVVASHQEGRDHGATTLTYYYPLCDENPNEARRRLFAAGRDDWADVALADLETVHPDIRSLATRVDVVRWGHAMAKPRPGFLFGPDRRRASIPNGPIHFAHSDLSGIALFEEAFSRGQRAGTEALQLLRGQGA
jgi:hypothetical protein